MDERERQLQREIKELKEANEILQGALAFFREGLEEVKKKHYLCIYFLHV
ncbi:hypothetical protein HPC63_17100 [Treponema phagedenis]|nr:hypothetical protein [Treponema phagedenis]